MGRQFVSVVSQLAELGIFLGAAVALAAGLLALR